MNEERVERNERRDFLRAAGVAGAGLLLPVSAALAAEKEVEVAPAEDLMREHGVLNRLLLVYDEAMVRLDKPRPNLKPEALHAAASLMRHFIEDYHEKLEENYLFPRFERAHRMTDLVSTLRRQHDAGRRVTNSILFLSKPAEFKLPAQREQLAHALGQYVRMYRPHESREDTVLFPAFKEIVSKHEYDSLGELFEKKEHQLFGEDGFGSVVSQVSNIETWFDIADLNQFTPKV